MKQRELSEEESWQLAMYPLCTITHQPIGDDFTEELLQSTMSVNDIVLAKLDYGVEPHIKEYQFCTLPYDLPGEVWKPIPNTNHLISNKFRVKNKRPGAAILRQYKQEVIGIRISPTQSGFRVATMVYELFGDILPRYPNTREQALINHKIKFGIELTSDDICNNFSRDDMPGEVWKIIPGFHDEYLVSNMGRIKTTYRTEPRPGGYTTIFERILAQHLKTNYLGVSLYIAPKNSVNKMTHSLVMLAFQPRTDDDIANGRSQIDHINGNRFDNRLVNLRYVTPAENIRAAIETGCIHSKMSREELINLGHEYDENPNINVLAEKYHYHPSQMRRIIFGRVFKDIPRYIPTLK